MNIFKKCVKAIRYKLFKEQAINNLSRRFAFIDSAFIMLMGCILTGVICDGENITFIRINTTGVDDENIYWKKSVRDFVNEHKVLDIDYMFKHKIEDLDKVLEDIKKIK